MAPALPRWRLALPGRWGLALQQLAAPRLADHFAVLRDELPARERRDRPTDHVHPLAWLVAGPGVQPRLADRLAALWIEQHQIGIRPERDGALARIQAVQFGWRGRHRVHQPPRRDQTVRVGVDVAEQARA